MPYANGDTSRHCYSLLAHSQQKLTQEHYAFGARGQLILMFTSFVQGAKNKRLNWWLHASVPWCILLRIAVPNTVYELHSTAGPL